MAAECCVAPTGPGLGVRRHLKGDGVEHIRQLLDERVLPKKETTTSRRVLRML